MENKCPKCGGKLSFFYVKVNCPHCGCDMVNYNFEERLEEDHLKAEEEFRKLNEFIERRTPKFIKKLINFTPAENKSQGEASAPEVQSEETENV